MSLNKQLLEAMTKYVQSRTNEKVVEVYAYGSGLVTGGYCDTCSYSYVAVEMSYNVEDEYDRGYGTGRMMEYDGDLGEFIKVLSELD